MKLSNKGGIIIFTLFPIMFSFLIPITLLTEDVAFLIIPDGLESAVKNH